jgi:transketolase
MRNIFINSLIEKAETDPRILLITADLGYGVIDSFAEKFPNQFFNSGITEQSTVSMAAGLASQGFRPFVYSIANFPTFRAMEQLRNDVNCMQLGVTIVALGEGFSYGSAGYSHHLIEDISVIRTFDNFSIYSPTSASEIRSSISEIMISSKSALLRLGRLPVESEAFKSVKSGFESFNLWHKGFGANLIFHGGIGDEIRGSFESILNSGLDISVYSCYHLEPEKIAEFLTAHPADPIVVVEEHVRAGGLGTIFLEVANDLGFKMPILRIGIDKIDREGVGPVEYLRKSYGLDANALQQKILRFISSEV